jgi:GAF domain-containing protein
LLLWPRTRSGDDQAGIEVGGWSASARSKSSASCSPESAQLHRSIEPRRRARKSIVVLPVLFEGETKAVIELSSLQPFTPTHLTFLEQLTQSIGVVLNTIEATMRTENLLQQSQQLTIELQTRQSELQQTNEELASKAKQLRAERRVERKNKEVEQAPAGARGEGGRARAHLEVQVGVPREHVARAADAAQLDSILGQQLGENCGGNLSPSR